MSDFNFRDHSVYVFAGSILGLALVIIFVCWICELFQDSFYCRPTMAYTTELVRYEEDLKEKYAAKREAIFADVTVRHEELLNESMTIYWTDDKVIFETQRTNFQDISWLSIRNFAALVLQSHDFNSYYQKYFQEFQKMIVDKNVEANDPKNLMETQIIQSTEIAFGFEIRSSRGKTNYKPYLNCKYGRLYIDQKGATKISPEQHMPIGYSELQGLLLNVSE